MRIAGFLADSLHGIVGATPLSFQVLNGKKSNKTDTHSALATKLNVDRNTAKPLNFLMAYSGGMKALSDSLQFNNKDWSKQRCIDLARKTMTLKKGRKTAHGYVDGTDSDLYNYMDKSVSVEKPTLPMLGTVISEALWSSNRNGDFYTGVTNWLVQGTGAEIMDAMLVAIAFLSRYYGVNMRYMLSIHDEIHYLAPIEESKKAGIIWQIAHSLVWGTLLERLGMPGLPVQSVYASGIAIDYRLRKATDEKTTTISHDGSNEPDGKEYLISELLN